MNTRRTKDKGKITCWDLWFEYLDVSLRKNPTWWAKYDRKRRCKYFLYRKGPGGKVIEVMSYGRFRLIFERYLLEARRMIIYEGLALRLTANLGRIVPQTIQRINFTPGQGSINWKESKKMWAAKGERKGLIFHMEDDYSRVGWRKGRLPNIVFMEFRPCRSGDTSLGFREEFHLALLANPQLKHIYEYNPRSINDLPKRQH